MLKNDTLKNGTSSLGLYGTVPLRAWLPPLIIKSGTRFGARSKFWGVVRVGGQGWGDNSIQFINFGRVGDKSCKEWRKKIGGWKGG